MDALVVACDSDTIVAPITAPARAGVTIVRVSGAHAKQIILALVEKAAEVIANPRTLIYTKIFDFTQQNPRTLDQCLAVFFP